MRLDVPGQAWGVLEYRAGNLERARELFQQGVWAQPKGRDICLIWQVRPAARPRTTPHISAGQSSMQVHYDMLSCPWLWVQAVDNEGLHNGKWCPGVLCVGQYDLCVLMLDMVGVACLVRRGACWRRARATWRSHASCSSAPCARTPPARRPGWCGRPPLSSVLFGSSFGVSRRLAAHGTEHGRTYREQLPLTAGALLVFYPATSRS